MIRNIRYDFSQAQEQLNEWFTPEELMAELRRAAVELAVIEVDTEAPIVREMQLAVVSVCDFLETIKVKGGGDE